MPRIRIDIETITIPSHLVESVITLKLKDKFYVAIFLTDGSKYALKRLDREDAEKLEKEICEEGLGRSEIIICGRHIIKGKTGEDWNV